MLTTVINVELFKRVCVIHADLSKVTADRVENGKIPYYKKSLEVVLICGIELKAQIRWKENVGLSFESFVIDKLGLIADIKTIHIQGHRETVPIPITFHYCF